jgi:lysophospholipase L1-like esterase
MALPILFDGRTGAQIAADINAELGAVQGAIGTPTTRAFRAMIRSSLPASWDLMPGAPSITLGVANAASAIAGGSSVAKDSPMIFESTRCVTGTSFPDTLVRLPRNIDSQASGAPASYTAATLASWHIITDAQQVEFRIKGIGFNQSGRIWVTENGVRKMAGFVPAVPSNGSMYLVLVEFSSSAMREIEVEMSGGFFGGWNISSGAVVGKKEPNPLHVMIAGDSFTEGSGATLGYMDGYAARLFRLLGADKKTASGIGGTGYSANLSGSKKNLLERLQNDVIGLAPDVLIHTNGINDSLEGIIANAPSVFDTVSESLPNCLQIVFAPFQPRSIDTEGKRAALESICAERGLIFIDNVTEDEITGTGRMGAPASNGNSDIVISSDGTHPSPYGHEHIARWRFAAICKAIGV